MFIIFLLFICIYYFYYFDWHSCRQQSKFFMETCFYCAYDNKTLNFYPTLFEVFQFNKLF